MSLSDPKNSLPVMTIVDILRPETQRLLKKFLVYLHIEDQRPVFAIDEPDELVRFLLLHHEGFKKWLTQHENDAHLSSDWDGRERRDRLPDYLAQYPLPESS